MYNIQSIARPMSNPRAIPTMMANATPAEIKYIKLKLLARKVMGNITNVAILLLCKGSNVRTVVSCNVKRVPYHLAL